MGIRTKYFFIGALFGMCFPLGAISFELHNTSLPLGFASIGIIHANNPLLFMIDSAPLFLGLFAWFGGVSKAKSLLLIEQLKKSASQLSENTDILQQQTEDTLVRYQQSISKLTKDYSSIEDLNRSSYNQISTTLEGTSSVSREVDTINSSLEKLSGYNKQVEENNTRVKEYLDVYLTNVQKLHGYFEYLNEFSREIELLAINSAIEANKHGTQGKAFLVFSRTIQELAQDTKKRNSVILVLIDNISEETIALSEVIESEHQNINAIIEHAAQVNNATQNFSKVIDEFTANLEGATHNLNRQNELTAGFSGTLKNIGTSNVHVMQQLEGIVQQQIEITTRMNHLTLEDNKQ